MTFSEKLDKLYKELFPDNYNNITGSLCEDNLVGLFDEYIEQKKFVTLSHLLDNWLFAVKDEAELPVDFERIERIKSLKKELQEMM